jgi:hypothetical protein
MYRIKWFSFLSWWLASSVFVWPLAVVALGAVLFPTGMIYSLFSPPYGNDRSLYMLLGQVALLPIIGAVIAFVMSSVQRWLLRSKLYWSADGWRLWSTVGGAVGGFVVYVFFEAGNSNSYSFLNMNNQSQLMAMPVFLAFVAGCQALPLRHAVKYPWLWAAANIVAGVTFAGVLLNNEGGRSGIGSGLMQLGILGLALAALGLVTGFTILHLFERHLLPMNPEGMENMPAEPRSVWDNAV